MMTLTREAPTVLIVEDERIFALDLKSRLEQHAFEVLGTVASADAAVLLAARRRPEVILMDIHLDGSRDGISAAEEIGRELRIPVVFLTAYAEDEVLRRARDSLPYGYLVKPCETSELVATLHVVAARRAAERAVESSENRLRLALDVAAMGVWEWLPESGEFSTGGAIDRIIGPLRSPVSGTLDGFLAVFVEEERQTIARTLAGGGSVDGAFRFVRPDGAEGWLQVHAKSCLGADSRPVRVIGLVKDITDRRQAESRLRQAKVVFDTTDEGILITDAARNIVSVNPAFTHLTGLTEEEAVGADLDVLVFTQPRGEAFYDALLGRRHGAWQGEVVCRRRDGSRFSAWEHIAVVHDAEGEAVNLVVTLADISAIRAVEAQLNFLAHHDPLTGLANRILLGDRIEQLLGRSRRQQRRFALLFIDIDNFKVINDTLGHGAGDQLLKAVAIRIREQLRQSDTVARLGGDEFTVVVGEVDHAANVAQLAHKLLEVVSQPCVVGNETVSVTASIGVAFFPEDGDDAPALLKAADSAMYQAKAGGRNVFMFYAAEMATQLNERLVVEQGLRRAIDGNELELHYQPVFELATGRVVGAEALVRWRRGGEVVSPARFISIAEQTSLIERLGAWVLDAACAQAAQWQAHGLPPIRLAVNVSPRQLGRGGFDAAVRAALDRWSMPAGGLELEMTESAIQVIDESRPLLAALKQLGVHLAIDDFGTGYSSLSVLKHLPVDRLKIDRSFVSDLATREDSRAIVRAIIALGKTLDLRIVAEGIESNEQLDLLREAGCDEGQGYLVCRPLPAEAFAAWLDGACVVTPGSAAGPST